LEITPKKLINLSLRIGSKTDPKNIQGVPGNVDKTGMLFFLSLSHIHELKLESGA
jgi:hypothetical protein